MNEIQFSKFDGDVQTIWDVSSLDSFKRCPRYYKYSVLDGWRAREKREDLVWGSGFHDGLEVFDSVRFYGGTKKEAIERAVMACFNYKDDLAQSPNNKKTLDTLIRSIVWYGEQYGDDTIKTATLGDNHPAIEVRFEVPIPGTKYRLSGRVDKLAIVGDELYVVERKTTETTLGSYYFNRYSPNTQVTGYTWAVGQQLGMPVGGVMIEACQTAVGFSRFERAIAHRTPDQLKEFLESVRLYIETAERYAETKFWPMNESACMLYGGCKFRDVCERPEKVRQTWLENDFDLRPYKR